MLEKSKYEEIFKKGCIAENIFREYMISDGFTFIAGDIDKQTINPDIFEECFQNCRYIPSTKLNGSKLAFYSEELGRDSIFIMPDGLYSFNKNNATSFFDVKSRKYSTLKEKKYKMINYLGVSKYTYVECYVAIVIYDVFDRGYNIYYDNVSNYVTFDEVERYENGEWVEDIDIEFDISVMKKMNKYPIEAR